MALLKCTNLPSGARHDHRAAAGPVRRPERQRASLLHVQGRVETGNKSASKWETTEGRPLIWKGHGHRRVSQRDSEGHYLCPQARWAPNSASFDTRGFHFHRMIMDFQNPCVLTLLQETPCFQIMNLRAKHNQLKAAEHPLSSTSWSTLICTSSHFTATRSIA